MVIIYMINKIKKSIVETLTSYKKINLIYNRESNDFKNAKVNLGQIQSRLNNVINKVTTLSEVEFQVFSQFGDDGIIDYLVNKIPLENKTFIEFGVEDYRESNTRFLLINKYWSGLVIDGDPANIQKIKSEQLYNFYDLRAVASFITSENINNLITLANFNAAIGILSIDIDGNDYWVWNAINCLDPSIVICEYNSLFGIEEAFTIPYSANFVRGINTPLNFYGTSLKAIYILAKKKGYFFIGCNKAGNNAYFIHERHRNACPVEEKSLIDGYIFASFTESWDELKEPRRGTEKIRSINKFDVIDVETMESKSIDSNKIINSLHKFNKFNGFNKI